MKQNKKNLCTICARAGSKGVKNKNIRYLHGKRLIAYTIQQALKTELFEHVVISTDSEEIADISKKYGGEVFFRRDKELSTDKSGKLDVIKDAVIRSEKHFNDIFEYVIDLDATSPLREITDITNAFQQFVDKDNDNLITAMPSRRSPYFNLVELDSTGKVKLSKQLDNPVVRRQDAPKCYDMNASIYIWKRDVLLNNNTLFLNNTGLYIMPEERSIDIDSELDFEFVEFILRKNNA